MDNKVERSKDILTEDFLKQKVEDWYVIEVISYLDFLIS